MKIGRGSQTGLAALAVVIAVTVSSAAGLGQANSQTATRGLYRQAQKLEAALEVRIGGTRTQAEYLRVIDAYQKVEHRAKTPLYAAPSLMAIGRLYDEMGHLFNTSYFQKELQTYQYLIRVYPHSLSAPEALYAIAGLADGPLQDHALARKSLQSLINKYPSSDEADHARLALAQPAQTRRGATPNPSPRESTSSERRSVPAGPKAGPNLSTHPVEGGKEGSSPALVRTVATEQLRDATQIIVYLTGPVKYQSAQIMHPERVYFDLSRSYLVHPHGMRLKVNSPYVNSVVVAQNQRYVVRVVLDISQTAGYSATLLSNPYRLVIEVGRKGRGNSDPPSADRETGRRMTNAEAELATKGGLTPAKPIPSGGRSMMRVLGLKVDRIVIDPGHGGFDTGAIGPTGLEEKTVTLEIARRLARLIRERLPGTKVFLTRDSDTFVPLEQRTEIANKDKADLFISIHANSSTDPHATGTEVYYLNFATSSQALAVAARENALAQVPVHKLQSLLKQISLNNKIEESQDLARDVDRSLVSQLHSKHYPDENRGVGKAPFVVLIGAHMPSILAEVNFISNRKDEHLLRQPAYLQDIALGLFDGIKRYLANMNSLNFKEEASASPAATR